MALAFTDTHNMIAYLTKSDASEGFEQILDFMNASVIKRKVIITEDTVRQVLRLNDAESIDCLPNEEIFADWDRMGYEKPSTKLKFHKNEFSSSMASAVICLATGRKFNFLKYISDSLVRNVDSSSKFYMYPRFLQLMIAAQVGDLSSHTTKYTSLALTQKVFANMRRVGKGFYGVDTLLFKGMLVPQLVNDDVTDVVADDAVEDENAAEPTPPTHATTPPHQQELIPSTSQVAPTTPPSPHQSPMAPPSSPPQQQQLLQTTTISMDLLNTLLETYTTLTIRVENLEQDKIAQALEITKFKQRVRRLEKKNKLEPSCLNRLRKVMTAQRVESSADIVIDDQEDDADAQERLEESQAQVYHIDLEHADKVLNMHDDKAEPAKLKEVIEVVTTAKLMTEVVTAAATTITDAPITAAPMIEQVKRKAKQDNAVLRYQALKRKPQTKAHARKNMMVYLKNMAGFKMDFFKVKKQKLDEEVEELKTYLEIVSNDEDNVYNKATPLALKVPVVDYQIHTKNNKPYYKIIRADGTHQLFLSFIGLLKIFDREDLEILWQIVQERFASSKLKNFSDDFLLNTLKTMFEKPNVKDQVWKNQRGNCGLAKV
uniref:Synaptobrevin, longin-like domain protein n=1 Tax=Tanacetum cinerariifolium TaxID=118510 RepID=A0A6L2MK76_TANCI|nr:hypothetical protein [Tanacetum cinerariifolium]